MKLTTLEAAQALMKKYDFQFFDSIIVAGALEANCTILYSEDMHHDLLVEQQLRILNLFR
jgi:predicted nucleic acid-binding protein